MKKLLIAKLAVVTLSFSGLIACSNGDNPGPEPGPEPEPTVYHTLTFTGEHCLMKDSKGKIVTEPVKFEAGQSANFYLAGEDESYLLPTENQVEAYVTGGEEEFKGTWKYNPNNGALSVKMTADVTVKATSSPDLKNYRLITFKGTDCHMKDMEHDELITEVLLKVGAEVKYRLEGETDFFLTPVNEHVVVTYTEGGEVYESYGYNEETGDIGFIVTDNITITASSLANIPVEQGKTLFYFKLGKDSIPLEEYESVYFTGGLNPDWEWMAGTEAKRFEQYEDNPNYYFFQIETSFLQEGGDQYGQYQLVKGLNEKSGVATTKQGLVWVDSYKSDECRAFQKKNPFFTPIPKSNPRINLGTHTFSTTVVIPDDKPLNNYTLSVEFEEAIPNDCRVLFFSNVTGEWLTPNTDNVEEDTKRNAAALMTRDPNPASGGKIFTYNYPQICPNLYEYWICVEKDTSTGTIKEFNKIFESLEPFEHNLAFSVNKEDKDDYTNKLFTGDHCAHFKDPFAVYSIIALDDTDVTHGTVKINGSDFYRPGDKVSAAIIPDDGYVVPEEGHQQEGIVAYTDENRSKVVTPKIEEYNSETGAFAFSLPKDETEYTTLYIEAYCHSKSMLCSINVKVDGEDCKTKSPITSGKIATVTFSNATGGCHIAKDLAELTLTHNIIGDYTNISYNYENEVGTLTFNVHSNIIIRGFAPKG